MKLRFSSVLTTTILLLTSASCISQSQNVCGHYAFFTGTSPYSYAIHNSAYFSPSSKLVWGYAGTGTNRTIMLIDAEQAKTIAEHIVPQRCQLFGYDSFREADTSLVGMMGDTLFRYFIMQDSIAKLDRINVVPSSYYSRRIVENYLFVYTDSNDVFNCYFYNLHDSTLNIHFSFPFVSHGNPTDYSISSRSLTVRRISLGDSSIFIEMDESYGKPGRPYSQDFNMLYRFSYPKGVIRDSVFMETGICLAVAEDAHLLTVLTSWNTATIVDLNSKKSNEVVFGHDTFWVQWVGVSPDQRYIILSSTEGMEIYDSFTQSVKYSCRYASAEQCILNEKASRGVVFMSRNQNATQTYFFTDIVDNISSDNDSNGRTTSPALLVDRVLALETLGIVQGHSYVQLYDQLGALAFSGFVRSQISCSDYATGMYELRFVNARGLIQRSIVMIVH